MTTYYYETDNDFPHLTSVIRTKDKMIYVFNPIPRGRKAFSYRDFPLNPYTTAIELMKICLT